MFHFPLVCGYKQAHKKLVKEHDASLKELEQAKAAAGKGEQYREELEKAKGELSEVTKQCKELEGLYKKEQQLRKKCWPLSPRNMTFGPSSRSATLHACPPPPLGRANNQADVHNFSCLFQTLTLSWNFSAGTTIKSKT